LAQTIWISFDAQDSDASIETTQATVGAQLYTWGPIF